MFNSQTTVDGSGAVVARYDKTHLYFMDEKWAVESNTGFKQTQLALKVLKPGGETPRAITRRHVTVTNAICMDINPYRFEAPWEAHELATASVGSDLVRVYFILIRLRTRATRLTSPCHVHHRSSSPARGRRRTRTTRSRRRRRPST